MNLTTSNGLKVSVDREKIESISPHIKGGSVVVIRRGSLQQAIQVTETPEEILKNR